MPFARHPRDERGRADGIELRIRQRLDMRKERVAQTGRRAGRGLGGKILRAGRAGKAAQAEAHEQQAFFQAMIIDWVCRVTCFVLRFRSGVWKTKYQA